MAGITLHYFDYHGRGETAKMIMRYYGMEYTDHLIASDDWLVLKTEGFCEFGQLPRLDIDGRHMVQSYSIYRYLCQKNGAYPADPYEIYLIESLCNLREDVYTSLMPNFYVNNTDGINTWYRDNMPKYLKLIERRLVENGREGKLFVGTRVSLADFVMFQFGYDHFLRPNLKDRFEATLRDNSPTFYHYPSSPTEYKDIYGKQTNLRRWNGPNLLWSDSRSEATIIVHFLSTFTTTVAALLWPVTHDSDIGASALLAGIDATAQAYHLSKVQVTASLLCLHPDSSPFLKQVKSMILAQTQSFGVAMAAKNFGVSEEVIRTICRDIAPGLKIDPQKPPDPPAKPAPKPNLPADNPNIEEGAVCQLRRKVKLMYDQKVKIRAISALYGLNDNLVHSWGEFTRSRDRDKMLMLKSTLQERLDQGTALSKAAKEMKMSQSAAEQILGICDDLEASQGATVETCQEAVRQARVSPSLNSVSRKMKIPKGCIRRWLKEDFSFCGGDSRFIKGEPWASATRKRRCLEEFYLSGEVGKAAIVTEMTPEQAQGVVNEFEGKISQRKKEPGEEQDDGEAEGLRVN